MSTLHDDQLPLGPSLVRALVDDAFPEYAGLPLRPLKAAGSTNALFHLGDELLVRLPQQPGGSASIEAEARWLPEFTGRLPVEVPEVVGLGRPAHGFPESWSIVRWLPGEQPESVGPHDPVDRRRSDLAHDLADVIRGFRAVDVPVEAAQDPALRSYRGGPLEAIDETTRDNIKACRRLPGLGLDLDAAQDVWAEAVALPCSGDPDRLRWVHADLVAENLLVREARLSAVLDFGGLCVGDPTVDLIPAWELLDAPSRAAFRAALDVDDLTWARGRAWALAIAIMTFPYYWESLPERCARRRTLAQSVLADGV